MKPGCKTTSNSVFFFLGQETLSSSQLWLSPVCLLYFYIEHFISGHQVCRSLWEMWKFVSTSSKFLWHQLGVLQFSSILTLFIWRQPQIPQVKGLFQDYPPPPPHPLEPVFRHQLQAQVITWADLLPIELSSALINLLGWLTELRDMLTFTSL